MGRVVSIRLSLCIFILAAAARVRGQASSFLPHDILGGRATILLPEEDFEHSVNTDSTRYRLSATADDHRFVVVYYLMDEGLDADQFLRASSQAHIDEAPENATVNYDLVEGACFDGAELSFDMWTPVTKPMGLRYSLVRLYVIDRYFLSLSVLGLGKPVSDDVSGRFFESLTVTGAQGSDCGELN